MQTPELPIKKICYICSPGITKEEGYRLSHGVCEEHAKQEVERFRKELLEILD